MQLFVMLSCFAPWSVASSAALIRCQETLLHVPSHLPLLVALQTYRLSHLPDLVIGLSGLVIAAILITFIIGADKLLPFRAAFILLAVVVTICGFAHMAVAVMPANPYLWLVAYLSIVAVLLALISAVLFPLVLRLALPMLRALPFNKLPAPQISAPPSAAPLSTPPAQQPAPQLEQPIVIADEQPASFEQPAPVEEPSPAGQPIVIEAEPPAPVEQPAPAEEPAPAGQPIVIEAEPPASSEQPASSEPAPGEQPAPQITQTSIEPPTHDDARLLAAMDSSQDAFFIFDPIRDADGKIIDFAFKWLSRNGEILLQKPRSEILRAHLTGLLPIDPAPQSFEQYRLVQLTGKPYIHEFPLKRDDVYSTWMRHHVVKLEDGIAITATNITERRHSEQYLLHLTQYDTLTGLPTRALLDDRILQSIARANRYRSKVAVFLIHLDPCQPPHELHRSRLEDHVLLAAANRLRAAIRSTDSIIRLSNDDFVIAMSDIYLTTDIRRAAATLVTILAEPITLEEQTIQLTCSLGVTIYPDTAATVEDLLGAADSAMCRAKSEGRNKYVLFAPVSRDEAQQLAG